MRVRDRLFNAVEVTPVGILAAEASTLCAGLSASKAESVRNAVKTLRERELTLAGLVDASDDEVVTALTEVCCVGVWTAKMYWICDCC